MNRIINTSMSERESVSFEELLDLVSKYYTTEEIAKITRAYHLANQLHAGFFRQSGEPYIVHPVSVAYILVELSADCDTICAGLLHDVVEDTEITIEEIEAMFDRDIASLVDGVTRISKLNFSSKIEERMANTRKILISMATDIRIILIKLADRLHNMRTLQYKSKEKQRENSYETMEVYAPIAYMLGTYRIKNELEDLSFYYLEPEIYQMLYEKMERIKENSEDCIEEMLDQIYSILNDRDISNEVKVRAKNIYGVYHRLVQSRKELGSGRCFLTLDKELDQNLSKIHDLLSFKIMVDEIDQCYLLLRPIHEAYKPFHGRMKDYIASPKTNMYQSLHTTVFGPNHRLVQMQIRTFQMDQVASFGLATYWNIHQGNVRERMQEEFKRKCPFYQSLLEIDREFVDNYDFVNQVKNELLSEMIYVYTPTGQVIELPQGSTVIDFAYRMGNEYGNAMVNAVVNDQIVPLQSVLHKKDRVQIITDQCSTGPQSEWLDQAKTTHAKQMIKQFLAN